MAVRSRSGIASATISRAPSRSAHWCASRRNWRAPRHSASTRASSTTLSITALETLQRTVIGDARFVTLGLRRGGGFVGEHDRTTGAPLPEHIGARPDDLRALLLGLSSATNA